MDTKNLQKGGSEVAAEKHSASDLARSLDCLTEDQLCTLGKLSVATVEAWRKRGKGPAYILFGNRYLYPRQAVLEHLAGLVRERTTVNPKSQL